MHRQMSQCTLVCRSTSTKRQAASTFGPIEPAGNLIARSSATVALSMGCSVEQSEVCEDCGHVGQQQQDVGLDVASDQRRREVLVNYGFHALQLTLRVARHRYASTAGADDDRALRPRGPSRSRSRRLRWVRARVRHGATVGRHCRRCPLTLADATRLLLRVATTDEFRRSWRTRGRSRPRPFG